MLKDNLHFDAQQKLKAGIDKVARAVGSTMGTGGGNAVLEALESPGHLTTNDGFSIANSIMLGDPIEDLGRKMLLESINRANKASGDGSSTTCVLTAAIIEEGLKHTKPAGVIFVPKGEDLISYSEKHKNDNVHHPMDIKRSIEDCLPIIEASLNEQTKEIVTDGVIDTNLLEQVATISAEDEEIGKRIAEIYTEIGPKGIVYWDISKTTEDSYVIGSGITVEGATYASPYMCDATETGQNTNQIRIKNPYILLTKQKISSAADFNDIAQTLFNEEVRDLVVFADDFEPLIIPDLIKTRAVKGFRIAIIKMPVLWKDFWYEDLAKATGAKVVDPAAGYPLKSLKLEDLGRVGNIVVDKEDTFLDGIQDVTAHITTLTEEDTDDSLNRVARLNTKTARYYVGAQSDSALSYRRLKVEDAIASAYQALNGGIVPGGGVALANIQVAMPDTVGGRILKEALAVPYMTILGNAGIKPAIIDGCMGYDTKTRKVVDMFEAGIVDPKNVVLNAVKNAISVAATIITAPTIVLLPRMEEPEQKVPDVIR